ncbi:MAG: hypothetical protein A2776_01920 [Candidatus Levybacteria bacterium RIFCSPHIGHO2_01_FULL_40_10]|nr:MAG: hypothetical protein A2776_01920 [Candidatus Levybacteria bacterium RIFCSPHIGHO2_01_FULL_40_10]
MFINREEAGKRLALLILKEKELKNTVIIAIPRGGVVIGRVVSDILEIPLEVLIVKKIPAPNNPELAIGATGSDGVVFWDGDIVKSLRLTKKDKENALLSTQEVIKAREKNLGLKLPDVYRKKILLVDDGVATGSTVAAASLILKKLGSQKIILAVPVIAKRTKGRLSKYFDKIMALEIPYDFSAVGQFYREFPQVDDEEVSELLRSSRINK